MDIEQSNMAIYANALSCNSGELTNHFLAETKFLVTREAALPAQIIFKG